MSKEKVKINYILCTVVTQNFLNINVRRNNVLSIIIVSTIGSCLVSRFQSHFGLKPTICLSNFQATTYASGINLKHVHAFSKMATP